jgi:peptidoglycan hydrolase CwlO-like protein
MKYSSTTPVIKRFVTSSAIVALAVMVSFSSDLPAFADEFDDRINVIQGQIGGYQAQAAALGQQADTLQTAVASLQAQQDTIQAQINLSQAKYEQLVAQIKETEEKIVKNQDVLGETISNLYVDNSVTPVEMLASSKSIGDFLDQQEYRSSVRDQVESAIKEIKALKKSLEKNKAEVEQVLADQKAQKDVLAQKQGEQARLLAETQGNEAAYQGLIASKSGEISQLRAQQAAQAAANSSRASRYGVVPGASGGSGGYPSTWSNAPQDSVVDNWGMYNRECVSYAAWRVYQAYHNMPYWGGHGNANQWPGNADASGIPRGSTPRPGSVAIYYDSVAGHAAWVESVNGNSVTVSQYNYFQSQLGSGRYSTMTVSASFFDTYIYFGG